MRDKWKWWGQDGWESEDRDIEEEENTRQGTTGTCQHYRGVV